MNDANARTTVYRAVPNRMKPPSSSATHSTAAAHGTPASSSSSAPSLPSRRQSKKEAAAARAAAAARDRAAARQVCRAVLVGVGVVFLLSAGSVFYAGRNGDGDLGGGSINGGNPLFAQHSDGRDGRHSTRLVGDPSSLKPRQTHFNSLQAASHFHPDVTQQPLSRTAYPGLSRMALPMREKLMGIEVLWQIPPPPAYIRGAVLLFHGCGRHAMSFFYSPEGRVIVEAILARDMALAAFSKRNDANGCWDVDDGEHLEVERAAQAWLNRLRDIPGWQRRIIRQEPMPVYREAGATSDSDANGAGGTDGGRDNAVAAAAAAAIAKLPAYTIGIPIYGFGASSGGYMVAKLANMPANRLNFRAINVQVAAPGGSGIRMDNWVVPTAFSVMSRDWATKQQASRIRERLEDRGVDTLLIETTTKKIGPAYFESRFPGLRKSLSAAIFRELRDAGVVDETGEMIVDPRRLEDGVGPLAHMVPHGNRVPPGVSDDLAKLLTAKEMHRAQVLWLAEELNVAWNAHEIFSDRWEEVLDFFQKDHSRPKTNTGT